MAAGRFFRGLNLYLVLAGLLSLAMLFAPIAFASNYATGMHATVYGSWVGMEESLGHGITMPRTLYLNSLPLQIPYVILVSLSGLMAFFFCFYNRDEERKLLWIGRTVYVSLAAMLWGVLVRFMATNLVGESELPDALDAGFQREFLLHFFILYFLWRAWSRLSTSLKAA